MRGWGTNVALPARSPEIDSCSESPPFFWFFCRCVTLSFRRNVYNDTVPFGSGCVQWYFSAHAGLLLVCAGAAAADFGDDAPRTETVLSGLQAHHEGTSCLWGPGTSKPKPSFFAALYFTAMNCTQQHVV